MKEHSRNFYKVDPAKISLKTAQRLRKYWSDPERFKRETCEWRLKNRAQWLERQRLRRIANRDVNRARARLESLLLTDSYIRNQLSKHSNKTTKEWTDDEVRTRRLETLGRRLRRIDDAKAREIRTLAARMDRFDIAEKFGVSPSLIWLILSNKIHADPEWKPERKIRSWSKASAFFKRSAEIGQLAEALMK